MMNEENEYIEAKIERYVKGEMPEMERVLFESEIWLDAALHEKVVLKKSAREVMLKAGLDDIRQMMQKDLKPQYRSKTWRSKWLGIIAALLFVGTVGYFYRHFAKEDKLIESKQTSTTVTAPVTKSIESTEKVLQEMPTKPAPKQKTDVRQTIVESKVNDVASVRVKDLVVKVEHGLTQKPTNTSSEQTSRVLKKEEKADLCADFKPNFTWRTIPSLVENSNGKIIINTINKDLSFALEGKEVAKNYVFENLAEGTYHLQVSNADGCKADGGNIMISKTFCKAQVQDIFHVQNDEKYALTSYPEEATEAWVYDKTMKEIARFDMRMNVSWDGKNQNAQPVPVGLYKVEIHYKNGDKCFHNVTVFE